MDRSYDTESLHIMKLTFKKQNAGKPTPLALSAAGIEPLVKKLARVQTALVIGLILQAGLAAAQNLVTNPGFETGDISGWFAFGPPTISVQTSQVHSGTYACLVTNRNATWNGIAQSFVGIPQTGQTYDVSAWVRLVDGANQTV